MNVLSFKLVSGAAAVLFLVAGLPLRSQPSDARTRVLILADMGNEPDEMQQMVHMIVCSNEFDLEGLIAVTGKYLQPASPDPYKRVTHPELFHEIIDAYERVLDNLKQHASGWHETDYLRRIVAAGQPGYGIADTGPGKSSPGSDLIIEAVTKNDPRPLWIVVNAGSNTLAQALIDYRASHTPEEVEAFVDRIRVFENGAQDNAGAWIAAEFPEIHWIRSNYQTYCYGGPDWEGGIDDWEHTGRLGPHTWGDFPYSATGQHQWALEHIKGGHGPLGAAWPIRQFENGEIVFLEGGGTIPFLGPVNRGLFSIDHPHWGGWGGRFTREKEENYWSKHESVRVDEENVAPFGVYAEAADHWINPETGEEYRDIFAPVWRWRRAFFNDFTSRMDWCVKPFEEANHHPVAAFAGDRSDSIVRLSIEADQELALDASASRDPDLDALAYRWWYYPEAGTFEGAIHITNPEQPSASVLLPANAAGTQIHVILEVYDDERERPLYDYRRIVIDVKQE